VKVLEQESLSILFTGHLTKANAIKEAYQTEGINFLKKLDGSFSFLLYDKLKKKLFIAKDKVGIEPLYFSDTDDNIIISSHLREFHNISTFQATINPSSVGEYLQFGFVLQPNTIFKNCHKVCAGEYVCFDLTKNTYSSTKYWELESCYLNKKTTKKENIILKEVDSLLQEAVEKNTKNSNFGLSLSGGYDSSTLTAIAQEQSEQKVDTFSIGFHEKSIDEAPYAKAIAKHIGTNHHEYYFSEKDALELIPQMCKVYDEPFADHASTPTILTSLLLKKNNLSNLIAGDGGDEVFATAENVQILNLLKNTPMPIKKLLAKSINSINIKKLPYLKDINNLPKKQNKLQQLLLAPNIPKMIYSRNTLFLEEELQSHIKDYSKPIKTSFDNINFRGHAQTVDEVIGSYFKTTMADGELVKSYSAMNYLDIKLSTPFLDIKLVEYMAQVPSNIKIKNRIKKYLLKEIAHQYIPKELVDRPKSGFDIPFSSWMRGILKDILYSQINKERLDKDNIFYTSYIINIRDQFYAGNDAYKYKLWRIFIFQLWYENFTLSKKQ
jgi:asparagine synthase (glutamine-hydrolysing)